MAKAPKIFKVVSNRRGRDTEFVGTIAELLNVLVIL
jgi:hypothetical protein